MDVYMTLVPGGLDHIVQATLKKEIGPLYSLNLQVIGDEIDPVLFQKARDQVSKYSTTNTTTVREAGPNEKKRRRIECLAKTCDTSRVVGVYHPDKGQEISFGYDQEHDVYCTCGSMDGLVWLKFATSAPVSLVYNIRCIGPLLALCNARDNLELDASKSLPDVLSTFQTISLVDGFDQAIETWKKHAMECWNLTLEEKRQLDDRIQGHLQYRLSCMRKDSKSFKYSRQELVKDLVSIVVPHTYTATWKVNLDSYDLEVVVLLQAKSAAVGLCLRPYQLRQTKSFDVGRVPPDISLPYLSSNFLNAVVRLRPSTAAILLQLAELRKYDVVVDPCVGIGTLAFEALFQHQPVISIGGDLILTPDKRLVHASKYATESRQMNRGGRRPMPTGAADLLAWDGCSLPLRNSSADVVISDLPFGQKCLSSSKLGQILPLLMDQMARVVHPLSGRAVLLCGTAVPILEVLKETNARTPDTWILPCASVFPVNIGGIQAWIVKVRRGKTSHQPIPNYCERTRKIANSRERVARHRYQPSEDTRKMQA